MLTGDSFKRIVSCVAGALAIFWSALSYAGKPDSWVGGQPMGVTINDFDISPDGNLIAFEYLDRTLTKTYSGLGVLEWKSGKLIRIHEESGTELKYPAFYEDGSRLLFRRVTEGKSESQFVVYYLDTQKLNELTPPTSRLKMYPVVQKNSGNILYVSLDNSQYHLVLLNPKTQEEIDIIPAREGFYILKRPSFIGENEILFEARGPFNEALREYERKVLHTSSYMTYRMTFGEVPQVFSPEAEKTAFARYGEGAFPSMSATLDGEILSFINVDPDKPTDSSGRIIRELYKIEPDETIKLTAFDALITQSRMAVNGSVIAFIMDEGDGGDLFIYDMKHNDIRNTDLLKKIMNEPAFALK